MSGHCRDLVGSAIRGKPAQTREEVGCFDSLRGLKKALRLGQRHEVGVLGRLGA